MRRALMVVALALAGCAPTSPAPSPTPTPQQFLNTTTVDDMQLERRDYFTADKDGSYRKRVVYVARVSPQYFVMQLMSGGNVITPERTVPDVWVPPEEPTPAKAVADFIAHEAKR